MDGIKQKKIEIILDHDKLPVYDINFKIYDFGIYSGIRICEINLNSCNLSCEYCWSLRQKENPARWFSAKEIYSLFFKESDNIQAVVFTGGEPGLYFKTKPFQELLYYLKQINLLAIIETNGTIQIEKNENIWIVLSPKKNSNIILKKYDELNLVYDSYTWTEAELINLLNIYKTKYYWITPFFYSSETQRLARSNNLSNILMTKKRIQELPYPWRFSLPFNRFN